MEKETEGESSVNQKSLDPASLAECRECTCFNFRRASRAVTQLYDDKLKGTGLRATQFALIVHVYVMGPVTLSKLSEAMATDRTTLSRNLELLENTGLIKLTGGEDRRTRIIEITGEGRKKLAEAYPVWKKTQEEVKKLVGLDKWSSMISQISEFANQIRET